MNLLSGKVLYSKCNGIAWITLNRPEVLNALDSETHEILSTIWKDVEEDSAVRVAVLQGAGERAFCVGQDLKESVQRNQAGYGPTTYGSQRGPGYPRLTERFDITKPIIAKVDGYALGGGFELALACDLIIASRNATFGLPEVLRGMIPGAGGVFRLMRQLPCKIAMGYLLSGRFLSALKAYELGLINEVVETEKLDQCVESWLEDILKNSPLSIASIKETAYKSMDLSLPESFTATYRAEEKRLQGNDYLEGPLAFIEKRTPMWVTSVDQRK